MKFQHLFFAVLSFGFFYQSAMAQGEKKEQDVTVFESVLKTADWANFKYMDELNLAKNGDRAATFKLLKFSGTVDGKDALDHSVTLLELLNGQDVAFASALVNVNCKPALKTVILERLQLAQGRTTKEALRKPIEDWAPTTWAVLHGEAFTPPPTEAETQFLQQMQQGADSHPKSKPGAPAAAPLDQEDVKPSATTGNKVQKENNN